MEMGWKRSYRVASTLDSGLSPDLSEGTESSCIDDLLLLFGIPSLFDRKERLNNG